MNELQINPPNEHEEEGVHSIGVYGWIKQSEYNNVQTLTIFGVRIRWKWNHVRLIGFYLQIFTTCFVVFIFGNSIFPLRFKPWHKFSTKILIYIEKYVKYTLRIHWICTNLLNSNVKISLNHGADENRQSKWWVIWGDCLLDTNDTSL